LDLKFKKMFRCLFIRIERFFDGNVFISVLLGPLKYIAIFLRWSAENPWERYSLKKRWEKRGGGGQGRHRILRYRWQFSEGIWRTSGLY
jgi:hypothetical protein